MAYSRINFKTKKELKAAVQNHQKDPINYLAVGAFQPGPFGPNLRDGRYSIEGPHYPEPHRWYALCEIKDGLIIKVIS